jgi:hypothetical protein
MLKKSLTTRPKFWLAAVMVILALAVLTTRAATSRASRPAEAAPIPMQEMLLDAAALAADGELTGLEATGSGLGLAPGQTSGVYVSPVIASPLAYTTDIVPLWAADLPGDSALRLETRLQVEGNWSDWLDNPEAFYPVRDDLHSGNLIWVGASDVALQFRVTLSGEAPQLNQILLVFNDTSQGPTDGEIAAQTARVADTANICPVPKPAVVSRTAWGCPDGQNSPRRAPQYAPVTHVIIHQTETPNNTAPYQDYAGWVRSVWNFHANVLRWGDVGYNYLIDPNGVIYEGRAGGDNVIGIHDTHNAHSLGIGMLGCYGNCDDPRLSVTQPSAAMLDSAATLIAWKLGANNINPLSSAAYGGLANIPVIAGGRDVVATSAPGDNVYNQLPGIRQAVVAKNTCATPTPLPTATFTPTPTPALQACQITGIVFGQESYQTGQPINVTVRLADAAGVPLVGANIAAEVTRNPVQIQASTGFGLVDRAGEYDGVYSATDQAGLYTFNFTAQDPSGQRFAPCTGSASIEVTGGSATATPLPTEITPTETPTTVPPTETPTVEPPTATPTATPTGPVVLVEPGNLIVPICEAQTTTAIKVTNVTNLAAVQLELSYDPTVIQVIDADAARPGVQVRVDAAFSTGFIAQNEVDTTHGIVKFAATLLGGAKIDGDSGLIAVDWTPQNEGSTALTLGNVILASTAGQAISHNLADGAIQVITNCSSASGTLLLQGRADHSSVVVTNGAGQQSVTAADGSFSIPQTGALTFEHPGYLSAQASPVAAAGGAQVAALGSITLLAGDINGDNTVNIFDLVYMAQKYGLADTLADLNADGKVDILDLVLSAGNSGVQGPLTAWN